jgi:hypothetical protein
MKTKAAERVKDNPQDLSEFRGTDNYYKNAYMLGMVYTDGVKHMAETRDAYWLIQYVYAKSNYIKALKGEPFLTIEMSVSDSSATIAITDGNDNILHTDEIEYTDYPDDGVCLWLVDGVLLLPSEY